MKANDKETEETEVNEEDEEDEENEENKNETELGNSEKKYTANAKA